MKSSTRLLFSLTAGGSALLIATTAHADNWNCGGHIVSTGDTALQVSAKCGEPTWKDTFIDERFERARGMVIGGRNEYEVWIYNLGPSQLIRYLHFSNNALTKIETGDHGMNLDEVGTRHCRPEEIHEGMDKFTVWAKCGEPVAKNEYVEKRTRSGRRDTTIYYINVSEWVYEFGTQRFKRALRFENSKLVKLDELPRM